MNKKLEQLENGLPMELLDRIESYPSKEAMDYLIDIELLEKQIVDICEYGIRKKTRKEKQNV